MSTTTPPSPAATAAATGPSAAPGRTRPAPRGLPLALTAARQGRRTLLAWSVALAAVVLVYLPLFPSLEGSLQQQIDAMPEGMAQAFGMSAMDAPGYTQSTVYGLLGAVLVSVFALTAGTRALAAEEESGVLDLYLAHGVSRQRVLAERALHVLADLLVLVGVVVALTLAVSAGADLGLGADQVLAAGLGLLGIGTVVAAVTLAAGAATGSRPVAVGAGAVAAVGGYLTNVLPDLADVPWLREVSTFAWAYGHEPLRNGFDGSASLLLLYGTAALAYAVGALVLQRRDVGV